MLRKKIVRFKKIYKFYIKDFFIGITVFLINKKMSLNSREFKFLKNYRNLYGKSSTKRDYRDENVFLKVDRALSKLITLLILDKKELNHFFKSRSPDIVLLKQGNLYQNAKRYEARNTEREARSPHISEREAR